MTTKTFTHVDVMTHRGVQDCQILDIVDNCGRMMVSFRWNGSGPVRYGALEVREGSERTPCRDQEDIRSCAKLGRNLHML